MHIILTGVTGTCGSAVLQHCIRTPSITRLTLLSRSPVKQAEGHEKVTVVLHDDFTQYPETLCEQLKGAHGCVWALGISQTSVSKEQYIKITYDYTLAAAKAFSTLSDHFNFVYVSGEGADTSERSRLLFGQVKGRTENHLHALSASLPSLHTFAVRPGLIDPEGEFLRPRRPSAFERVSYITLAPIMRRAFKSSIIGTRPLARVLTELATGDGNSLTGVGIEAEGRTIRNTAARRLAGI